IRLMGLQETPAEPTAVAARAAAVRFYTEMPETLGSREFLAGPYSYADIAFYMAHVFGARMGGADDGTDPAADGTARPDHRAAGRAPGGRFPWRPIWSREAPRCRTSWRRWRRNEVLAMESCQTARISGTQIGAPRRRVRCAIAAPQIRGPWRS